MGVFNNFPYANFHELNADWIIEQVRKITDDWEEYKTSMDEWKLGVDVELEEFQTWFDNLDVQDEVRTVINELIQSGEFIEIAGPQIVSATEAWLALHVTPTTPPVDDTLSISGAAADAKVTGDRISDLKEDIRNDETFVGVHRSDHGIPNTFVPFHIPQNTVITVYTTDGEPFPTSNEAQIRFYDANQTQIDYFAMGSAYGNSRTIVYTESDAEYFQYYPATYASNIGVVWYENASIRTEKKMLESDLLDYGINIENLYRVDIFSGNNTAVVDNYDGTFTLGTSDYGRTYFGEAVEIEAGMYDLFGSKYGYTYLSPDGNPANAVVTNQTDHTRTVEITSDATLMLCLRLTGAPAEQFTVKPFLRKNTKFPKESFVKPIVGVPIVYQPTEPYIYNGDAITEQFINGSGNLLTPLYALYDSLESQYSHYVTKEVIGYDQSETYEMRAYTISQYDGATKPTILWFAAIHASELYAVTSTYEFMKELLENHNTDPVLGFIWRNCILKIIPVANPWGLANNANRYNSRGVNLNRNFPADWVYSTEEYSNSGPYPASEKETQNIMSYINANKGCLFSVNRHDSGTLESESGRMAYVVDAFKADDNVLRSNFSMLQMLLLNRYPWIVTGRPSSAYNTIFSTLSRDTTPGMMDKWFNMIGVHGCLLEISRPNTTGYTANKQQDFLKINTEININMIASVIMQNQIILSADDVWVTYPIVENT